MSMSIRELPAYRLAGLDDESEQNIFIEDFERLTMEDAREVLREAYRILVRGGVVECAVLKWGWLVERYITRNGTDPEMGEMLFGETRRAVWDDRTLAKEMLKAGFYRVWCGAVAEYPVWKMYAKALKFIPPET
jgi:predicted SAM-dependent methyltransferase